MRMSALAEVGTFEPSLIAGEEPELCLRLRRAGWTVHRLDEEITLHDAAIFHFSQFARRMIRSGWAYSEGADRHGAGPEQYNVRDLRRIWLWAVYVPVFVVFCILAGLISDITLFQFLAGLGLFSYLAAILRMARNRHDRFGDNWRNSFQYGFLLTIARPWQLLGALRYLAFRSRGGEAEIIEYKTSGVEIPLDLKK